MNDRDAIQTRIEARLKQFGETINTIRLKAEQQQDLLGQRVEEPLAAIEKRRDQVREQIDAMKDMNDDDWNTAKGSIDSYFDDIDDGLHKALAHFR
ncbi:MAG: hypothetical protein PVF97_02820 [Desulfobacterales bacterium]|jgi:hypothetical protein